MAYRAAGLGYHADRAASFHLGGDVPLGSRMMIDELAVMATRALEEQRARTPRSPRKATHAMFPYPSPARLPTHPQPLSRAIWDDLGLTPEQGARLGYLLDAPAGTARPSRLAALRQRLGTGIVRVGQMIQGPANSGAACPPCDTLGSAP